MKVRTLATCVIALVALLMSVAVIEPILFETMKSQVGLYIPGLRKPRIPLKDRLQAKGFALGQPVLLRVFKQDSELELWMKRAGRYEKVFSYPICRWSGTLGPKLQEGDGQSPEGFYFASRKQLLPSSRHHRAINTGFPNSFDASLGRTGTVLMIHGSCSSIGCYAMTDPAIDDIYTIVEAALDNGQPSIPMHLFPFRMTAANLQKNAGHPWISFWRNLAQGDALFAATGQPPDIWACDGKYAFAGGAQNCQRVASW